MRGSAQSQYLTRVRPRESSLPILIVECDEIQEEMNIARSGLVDAELTDLFRKGVANIFSRIESSAPYLAFRQIALQRALGFPTPSYAHLPLVLNADGSKLGKRDGALPLPSLDERRVAETLSFALEFLGVTVDPDSPSRMLQEALAKSS